MESFPKRLKVILTNVKTTDYEKNNDMFGGVLHSNFASTK